MIYRTALRLTGRSAWANPSIGDDPLREMAADVARRHPDIDHILPTTLALKIAAAKINIVLFDVREPREYAVSHLADAVLVPPRSAAALAIVRATLAQRPATEWAVFYCAIGVRSSALASQFMQVSDIYGPGQDIGQDIGQGIGIANLAGGLFRWANDDRPMVNAEGATPLVHPFNRHWRRFLVQHPTRGTGDDATIGSGANN
jgi:rhodanese-related sulfurtransferase